MKILFLAPDVRLDGELKGDSIHTLELARAFVRLGHDIRLAAHGDIDPWWGIPQDISVNLKGAGAENTKGTAAYISTALGKWKPKVVYERRFTPKLGLRLANRFGAKHYLEINGYVRAETGQPLARAKRVVGDLRLKRMYRKVNGFVTVTDGLNCVIRERYRVDRGKVRTVQNGVNAEHFKPTAAGKPPSEGDIHLVFVGNLAPWQGLDKLISAMEGVENATLTIAGSGSEEKKLRAAVRSHGIEDRVTFFGYVDYKDVPGLITEHHMGIAPFSAIRNVRAGIPAERASLAGSPLKVLEYLACGIPVITTDMEPLPGYVGKAGMCVKRDDAAALRDAIRELTFERIDIMSRHAREMVKGKTWDDTAKRIVEFIGDGK